MLLVGLTGNIGMGKSEVLSVFRSLGAVTLDSDRIVEILLNEEKVIESIRAMFGDEVILSGNKLDKKAVAAKIFSDHAAKQKLEDLLHPLVFERVDDFIKKMKDKDRIVIVEVPLLFEGDYQSGFNRTITVFTPEATALKRLADAGLPADDAQARLAAQLPIRIKKERADYIVDNSGSKEETAKQVEAIYRLLTDEMKKG